MTPEELAAELWTRLSAMENGHRPIAQGNDYGAAVYLTACAIRAAIAEEREGCAGIVDSWGRAAASFDKDIIDKTAIALTAKIAAAIRARL